MSHDPGITGGNPMRFRQICVTWLVVLFWPALVLGDAANKIFATRRNGDGCLVHTVTSAYQAGSTDIRVLPPNHIEGGRRYPVLYLLPVEPGQETRWGDPFREVKRHGLNNKHNTIFVFPEFSALPWYADHPTNPAIRQEAYFMKVVVPLVETHYPISDERFLLGFSKSGWGAWVLLLRHPDVFCRAAAWDAPLMMERVGQYGTGKIIGTQENFDRYRPARLLRENADKLRNDTRLILTGYGNFRQHHVKTHSLLRELDIPHQYQDGPPRPHAWDSGWLPPTVDVLLGTSR
jgi:S-formylglutathione hydrolase FrmB